MGSHRLQGHRVSLCLVGCIVIYSGLVSQRETETVKAMKKLDFEGSCLHHWCLKQRVVIVL